MGVVSLKGSLLLMAFLIHTVLSAPVIEENTALLGPDQIAEGKGCYYNYEHYDEGDRILTNEPCLNCTCHNRMLMCYLRVCPFTKAIGQDCKIEKKPDQCCPVITCPQVPVALLTSSTTETTASTTTAVGHPDSYGCVLDDNIFYADGAQVPSDPRKPCELCYCIRNQTACVMQECTLNVEGCKPVYQEGVCCPVRYDCDYDEVLTTPRPTAGLVTTPGGPNECKANDQIFQDGEMIENMTENPCEHCYCMRGDVVCAVQECGTPLENTECKPMPAEPGQCCPSTYQCPNGTVPAHVLQATPNLKPSPPVAPSYAQIKPEAETETPTFNDKIVEDSQTTNDALESGNAGVEQQEPEKADGPSDSTVAESSEVITEAPKEQAIIEINMTEAPQDVAEEQTQRSPSEALETDNAEKHPEEQQEISSVPEIVPEHDQVEEDHEEEEHAQEGHVEDGHDGESHDVETTTITGHYTEISVENVEMNTSPPEKAKPEILSASHSLDDTETAPVNTEVPQELTTDGPSSSLTEQLPENEKVSNQQIESDATGQPENHDAINQPENQVAIGELENQDTTSHAENPDAVSKPESQDTSSLPEHDGTEAQDTNQQTTSQPEAQGTSIQSEIQETTVRAEIQEAINQPDNQEASSQQDNQETVQPEHQDVSSPQVNQELSSQQEIVSSPTEPTPSSPVPQENEKPSAVNDIPETTPVPVSSTTTEAEPEEMPRIPGEGSCLHRGITYAPNTEVPSTNACKRCRCINSIVQCNDLECPEPPISLYSNCVPMPPTDDACCPTYFCEQKPSQEPEVDSMSIDKIDQGIEEGAPEEGIAPTTVASAHEDIPTAPESLVPGTHEITDYTKPDGDDGSQPGSHISEDAEEVKPSGDGSQSEPVIPSGEGSQPESSVLSEGSQPESVVSSDVPNSESVVPSEVSQPEMVVPSEVLQPESDSKPVAPVDAAPIDITTALPEGLSNHQGSVSVDQHEESSAAPSEDVHPVSHDNVESESTHDAEATYDAEATHEAESTPTSVASEIASEAQGGKLDEVSAQSISEVPHTTEIDDQQSATESPQHSAGEQVSFNSLEDAHKEPDHTITEATIEILSGSTAQPELEEHKESQGGQDDITTNDELEGTIATTAASVHEDSAQIGQEVEPQHGDMTNQEVTNVEEAHDVQESVTEEESGISGAAHTDVPSISTGEHEGAEHDSNPSESSQPIDVELVPTIDQAGNDLTATHDQSAPESPTTAIPEETSSIHAEYNEAQLPSTEGPSGASESPEMPEPMVTSGPPVLFPDISHQGAPIHIPGPVGINTNGLTSDDERLGETEAPIQELTQTEQPQGPEESSSSGDVQQASGDEIKDDTFFTTEGLNPVSQQTEEAAESGIGSEVGSGNNQITESSQTSEPSTHDNANEISPIEHEPSQSGGSQHVEEVGTPEEAKPLTEVSQTVTDVPQDQVQHHDETEIQPVHDETEVQPTHDGSEVQPTHDESEPQQAHDDTIQTHDESEAHQTHDDTQQTNDESEAQKTHDGSEVQPTHDESEAQQTHDGFEAETTHDTTETHERPSQQQVDTDTASITEKPETEAEVIATEAPQEPIVTHGDLPTPSEPSDDNADQLEGGTEPETSQPQQSQDAEVSASQPAVESHGHEQMEPESGHAQEVTQAPENDEVVTHIDSAGPQQVPEIANQVVETDTNAIEHATGNAHDEKPSVPIEEEKTGADEVGHTIEQTQEPTEKEKPPQPEEIIPEQHNSEVVPTDQQQNSDVVPPGQQGLPDATPEEHPESDHVPTNEDHSAGHTGPYLSGAHALEENQEQQTEQSVSEVPSGQTQPEQSVGPTGSEQSESSTETVVNHTGEAQSEPTGQQEENVPILPEVAHDEHQPEQPPVEEQFEPQELHPENVEDNAEASHLGVTDQEQHQTTSIPDQQGTSQESESTSEHQNVLPGLQVEPEEIKPAVSEHQESPEVTPELQNVVPDQQVDVAEIKPAVSEHQESPEVNVAEQETTTQQESASGQPSADGKVPQIEEYQEHILQAAHDSAPSATGEEEAQTPAPMEVETVHTDDATAAPEQPDVPEENQKPLTEAEKDSNHTVESTPGVPHEDLQEQTQEQPAIPEGQPNESITPTLDSGPSGSDLPISTPEEVAAESAPSAPSAPETAPSAPESVAPEEPSAPESIVPEVPSSPESVAPEQPSAPEYTATEQPPAPESEVQPSAPEQPVAPETQPSSSGQDEVPTHQESDIPSQPDQSSHLVEEIEKEQPTQEPSSSPIAEQPQSSPLPPVEIPSTEGPVLPPGLQNWSQKPYHPPSLPEHQQHHTTAEVPHLPEDSHYPAQPYDQDYEDEDNVSYGPGTCRYGGKVYLSAQQIPRDDPCDFCFCFRSDIICLQQSCPPPIRGCYQETIKGFCCPRYECHVSMATMVNITTTSTTTTTTVPPHFLSHHYNGSATKAGCQVKGIAYRVGDRIPSTSGPCLDCRCGADGQMKCDPTVCGPQESLLRQVMAASVSKRRRR